ncbi:MAG: ASPIC/UnbV domain-containing protein [Bryobacteraceae bacterium]
MRLIGAKSNRDAIGARVRLNRQTKWISAGSGYLSQHTKTLYFGLGEFRETSPIEILWPSGLQQQIPSLPAGAVYEIREEGIPRKLRDFNETKTVGKRIAAADNSPRLQDTWLQDPVPLPDKRPGPGLLVLSAEELKGNQDLTAAYTLFRRYLFEFRAPLELPLALLLNADGHVVKIYGKIPESKQVEADLRLIPTRSAVPYAGRQLSRPRRDYFKLGASLLWCGYPEYSLPYLEAVLRQQPDSVRTIVLVAQIHREAGRLDQAAHMLDEALRLDAKSAEAWNELGGLAVARGEHALALQHFKAALAAKAGLVFVLLNAAQAADKVGKRSEAQAYYREAVATDPASAEAAQGLGLLLASRQSD